MDDKAASSTVAVWLLSLAPASNRARLDSINVFARRSTGTTSANVCTTLGAELLRDVVYDKSKIFVNTSLESKQQETTGLYVVGSL